MLHWMHRQPWIRRRMVKRILPITFFALLLLGLAGLLLQDSISCADRLGCISVSPQSPLEIGILYASPGTNCPNAAPGIEELERLIPTAQVQENIPLRIVKEESGFSLSASQQALAWLLNRPNLVGVWVQDCPFGNDPSLHKLVTDGGAAAWAFTAQDTDSDIDRDFEALIGQINAQRKGKTTIFLLGRSPFRGEP